MAAEVKTDDIIKLILQFCQENGLTQSYNTLIKETQVSLNIVDSVERFTNDITHGRWDKVLFEIQKLRFPQSKLMDLYELIVCEMLELGEVDTALTIIQDCIKANGLIEEFSERCLRLEYFCKQPKLNIQDLYNNDKLTKDKRRQVLADKLAAEVGTAPPNRLLQLLTQSLRYQESQQIITPNIKLNLFTGHIPPPEDEIDRLPIFVEKRIKLGTEARISAAKFNSTGLMLAVGSIDGLIEIYDPVLCKLRTDLGYQAEEVFMVHKHSILSLAFSQDDELLASGDKSGLIKVWRASTGKLLRKLEGLFAKSVTYLLFGSDPTHLVAASEDIKIIGLKSGKQLREFKGHVTYVNDLTISEDGLRMISGAGDGAVKFWDYKTGECIFNFQLTQGSSNFVRDIYKIIPIGHGKNGESLYIVCNKGENLVIINDQCNIIKNYCNEKGEDFTTCCVSAHKTYVYGVTNEKYIYCFNQKTMKLEHFQKLDENEILNIIHHPLRNIMIAYTLNGDLLFLKP